MNILLEMSNTNYKVWHNIAKRLKEIYPQSRFAAIVAFTPGSERETLDFLKEQKDVKYEHLFNLEGIMNTALRGEVDFKALKEFEDALPEKSIWRLVSSDRGWGRAFMHGAVITKTFINQNNSYDNILRLFSGLLKSFRKIFDDFRVELFLPAPCMGSFSVYIYEQICRERGIPYIVPETVRVKNLFAFASDVQLRFPHIAETYLELYNNRMKTDLSAAEDLYRQLMAELENSQFFAREHPCFRPRKIDSGYLKVRFFGSALKYIYIIARQWHKQKAVNKSGCVWGQPYKVSVLWDNIMYGVKYQCQLYRLRRPDFGEVLPEGQKYIYYPLHTSPEYSTQFQGTMWMDQVYLIEQLAKSIPFDWVVYVKEHPGVVLNRTRPLDFYKRIRRFPNVRLAPIDMDMHKIICKAEMVAVVTGTSGWEAIQRGKPLIGFADNFWDVLGLSCKYSSIENLSVDIRNELNRIKTVGKEERKKRVVCYLQAVLMHSFEFSYPRQHSHKDGTDEQYAQLGREIADALQRHVELLKRKSRNERPLQHDLCKA